MKNINKLLSTLLLVAAFQAYAAPLTFPNSPTNLQVYTAENGVEYTYYTASGWVPTGTNIGAATTTEQGWVELATTAEADAGTDTERATTPEGVLSSINANPVSHTVLTGVTASQHHTATVNTDAESKCAGNTILEGDGDCVATPVGGGGDVSGPASSVDNRIVTFDLASGKLIQDSGDLISDIEASTTNVTTAGALMDSEVDADIKTLTIGPSATVTGSNTGDQTIPVTGVDFDPVGTDNSTDVTLGGTGTYLSILGQVVTQDPITESDVTDLTHTTDTAVTGLDTHDHDGTPTAVVTHANTSGKTPSDHHTATVDTFVTNKDTHDHIGGDGNSITHTQVTGQTAGDHHTATVDTAVSGLDAHDHDGTPTSVITHTNISSKTASDHHVATVDTAVTALDAHNHDGTPTAQVTHANTSGQTASDHHTATVDTFVTGIDGHDHDGTPTSQVTHANTTGRTATDHHTATVSGDINHDAITGVSTSDHHVATVNTNAQTICATASDVLQGDGSCVANGGGSMSEVLDDTSPQLGGNLDANTFDIEFDSGTGILDQNANEQIIFNTTTTAVNHLEVTNAITAGEVLVGSTGTDTDVDLRIGTKGTGTVFIDQPSFFEGTPVSAGGLAPDVDNQGNIGSAAKSWAGVYTNKVTSGSGDDIAIETGKDINVRLGGTTLGFAIKDFTLVEKFRVDDDGNVTLTGTVDGVDIAVRDHAATVDTFVTNKDTHNHNLGDGADITHANITAKGTSDHHVATAAQTFLHTDLTDVSTSQHHVATVNTNAQTICATATDVLQGDGSCVVNGGGGGDVTKVGTPLNDQIGIWTGDGTIEGQTGLTFGGTTLGIQLGVTFFDSTGPHVIRGGTQLAPGPDLSIHASDGTTSGGDLILAGGTGTAAGSVLLGSDLDVNGNDIVSTSGSILITSDDDIIQQFGGGGGEYVLKDAVGVEAFRVGYDGRAYMTTDTSGVLTLLSTANSSSNAGAVMYLKTEDGGYLASGDKIAGVYMAGSLSIGSSIQAGVVSHATEAWNASSRGAEISFETTPNGSTTRAEVMTILESGNIEVVNALTVSDEAYAVGWDASLEVPTKNAVYDKIESFNENWLVKLSDETTSHTTGTAKVTFRLPYAYTLTGDKVRAGCVTAPTGSVITFDINETATTILSTKLTIDATEKTSETAATAAVVSDSSLADDAEITIDIDGIGSTIAGAGCWVTLIGEKT